MRTVIRVRGIRYDLGTFSERDLTRAAEHARAQIREQERFLDALANESAERRGMTLAA